MVFVDASALVKRYVRERHSVKVRRLVAAGPVAVSRLSEVDVTGRTAGIRYAARGRCARGAVPDPVPPAADGPRHVASLILPGARVPAGWAADHGSRTADPW